MNYLRNGDTLIITCLDRLACSVVHLVQIAKRFEGLTIGKLAKDFKLE